MIKRRPQVALVIETSKGFGRGILRGITRYVHERGPWSIYIDERGLDDPAPPWLRGWKGDGIILRTSNPRTLAQVRKSTAKLVYLGEHRPDGVPMVCLDQTSVARLAAEHLLDQRLQHFGYVGIAGRRWVNWRRDAFVDRLAEAGAKTEVFEFLVPQGSRSSWERQQGDLAHWLTALPKPVGVLACYDVMGLRVLDACRQADLAVPEQVAVLGVDNDDLLCELADPPLSSVAPDLERLGYEAAALLDQLMAGGPPPPTRLLVGPLGVVRRQSSDVVAVSDADLAVALRLIREQACNGIDVDDLARQSGLSRRALERRFQKYVEHSPHAEILRIRIERAKQLLRETDLGLKAIAARSGFQHASYLAAVFRESTGHTPGEYRKLQKAPPPRPRRPKK